METMHDEFLAADSMLVMPRVNGAPSSLDSNSQPSADNHGTDSGLPTSFAELPRLLPEVGIHLLGFLWPNEVHMLRRWTTRWRRLIQDKPPIRSMLERVPPKVMGSIEWERSVLGAIRYGSESMASLFVDQIQQGRHALRDLDPELEGRLRILLNRSFHTSARSGRTSLASYCLACGADVDFRLHQGLFGKTALHFAAYCHDLPMCQELVRHKANVHALDETGTTPFVWAIRGVFWRRAGDESPDGVTSHWVDLQSNSVVQFLRESGGSSIDLNDPEVVETRDKFRSVGLDRPKSHQSDRSARRERRLRSLSPPLR